MIEIYLDHWIQPVFKSFNVVRQPPEMERTLDVDSYPDSNSLYGRQQHRIGLTTSAWLLGQLKAARKMFEVPKNTTILIPTNNTMSLFYINKEGGTRSFPLMGLPRNFEIGDSTSGGCLAFVVNAPKEKRKKRRIIKPFTIHPDSSDVELCPIQFFKASKNHSALLTKYIGSNLFVIQSNLIQQPLSANTLST
ncbi:hypothetical protein INT46_005487 [Mucor plumbeus]|uniref:Uncharacterized protein n=1 Tax=Mucor plumbeus TaxID=97098 RepID=A0A8H7UKR7_9FUNG|nr:hypothetical protein INT46_005487 [Mucor plumbeus]